MCEENKKSDAERQHDGQQDIQNADCGYVSQKIGL